MKTAVVHSKHCQKVTTTWRVVVANQKAVALRRLCSYLQHLIIAHVSSISENMLKKIKCFALLMGSHLLNHKYEPIRSFSFGNGTATLSIVIQSCVRHRIILLAHHKFKHTVIKGRHSLHFQNFTQSKCNLKSYKLKKCSALPVFSTFSFVLLQLHYFLILCSRRQSF